MRYFRLLAIAAFVAITYSWANSPSNVSVRTHTYIQEDVRNIIQEVVKSYIPQAEDVWFDRLWTQETSENEVQAHFIYSYRIPTPAESQVISLEGYVTLRKSPESGEGTWSLDEAHIGSEHIEFEDAPVIEINRKEKSTGEQ